MYAWTKTKESLIGDDGDSVQESVVIYGTVNIQLTGSADGSSAGVMAGATITGPGVNGGFGLELSEGGYSANGSITYTDRSFQTHTIYASDLVENGVISLTLETAAISAEGSTFSVNSLAASGGTFGVGRNDTAAAQATSMVGWAFESVAP